MKIVLLGLLCAGTAAAAPITYQVDRQSDDGRVALLGTLRLDAPADCSSSACLVSSSWSLALSHDGALAATLESGHSTLDFTWTRITPDALSFVYPTDLGRFLLRSNPGEPLAFWNMFPPTFPNTEPFHGSEIFGTVDFVGTIDQGVLGRGPFAVAVPEPGSVALLLAGLLAVTGRSRHW